MNLKSNKSIKIIIILFIISFVAAITHKLLINTELYTQKVLMNLVFYPFLAYTFSIPYYIIHSLINSLRLKSIKFLVQHLGITAGLFILWIIIVVVDKELLIYST